MSSFLPLPDLPDLLPDSSLAFLSDVVVDDDLPPVLVVVVVVVCFFVVVEVDDDDAVAADSDIALVSPLVVVVVVVVVDVEPVLDQPSSANNSFSLSEAPLSDEDDEEAPSRRGGQAELFWSTMFCW